MRLRVDGTLPFLLLLVACQGFIGDAVGSGTPGSAACEGAACEPECRSAVCMPESCEGTCVGASHLTRLTREEYANGVEDLFGVRVDEQRLPADHEIYQSFATNEAEAITEDDVDRYSAVAEDAAAEVDVVGLAACGESEEQVACAARFVDAWAPRVHRGPVAAVERDDYVALVEWSLAEGDSFEDALRVLVSTFLQSPSFLYRVERVATDDPQRLDGYAMASRLSLFLWRTTPDDALLAAAAAGDLDEPAGIEREARRLLADPRADAALESFVGGWLGIGDVERTVREDPAFGEEVGRAMRHETEAFAVHVVREAEGSFATLMSADYNLVDATMAELYGVAPPPADRGRVAVPGRRGVLAHASVMAVHAADGYTDPVYRGKMVRERVFCQTIPPPPDIPDDLIADREASLSETLSERERLSSLTGEQPCAGCHVLTNEIGFGFARYDSIGRSRERDRGGMAIDPSFVVEGPPGYETDVEGAHDGPEAFADALADSEDAALCMSAQWLRFALGRRTDEDGASVVQAHEAFEASGRDLRELIVAITTTDAFRHRRAPASE